MGESPIQCSRTLVPRDSKSRPVYLAEAGERRQTAALPARQLHAAEGEGLLRRDGGGVAVVTQERRQRFPLMCLVPHRPPAPPCLFCVMTPLPTTTTTTTFQPSKHERARLRLRSFQGYAQRNESAETGGGSRSIRYG